MKTNAIMKKISLFLLGIIAVVSISSCNKTEDTTPQAGTAELSFNILAGQSPTGLKETPCISANQSGNYILVTMLKPGASTVTTDKLDVFYIDNKPYTNSMKLIPGTYSIKEFIMKNDNQTPNDPSDDQVVAAGVHSTATYASLISASSYLDKTFTIEAFKKNTMNLELVCYDAAHYTDFGFEFFGMDQTVIREQNFFGDFCIKEVKDYNNTYATGSPYVTALGGAANIMLDMPAIFQIEVLRNGVSIGTYNNNSAAGVAQPLKVQYADPLGTVDHFEFKLSIMVRKGAGYAYVYFHSWTFDDGAKIASGTDGVVDFVLGNCVPGADLVIPPWMNLPQTCTYQITGAYAPGSKGGYVDAALNVAGGSHDFDFNTATYASWCANRGVTIGVGVNYNMDVYSSLYQDKLPLWAQDGKWAKMNWIMNHLDWYPGYAWSELQQAMWKLEDNTWDGSAHAGVPAIGPIGIKMFNDANAYGSNYKVPSGGWACIIFIDHNTGSSPSAITQTMFTKVDP